MYLQEERKYMILKKFPFHLHRLSFGVEESIPTLIFRKYLVLSLSMLIKLKDQQIISILFNLTEIGLASEIFNNDFNHFVFDLTAVKEFGNENGKTIDAYGWFAKAGYQFNFIPAKPILSLRESYASGGKKTDDKIYTFEPAYGASDKYYGWMNITIVVKSR